METSPLIIDSHPRELPPGPWNDEPDSEDFTEMGLHCMVLRNDDGALCGYVELPRGHPLWYRELESLELACPGGVTFSAGDDNRWLIGFDCAHADMLVPANPIVAMHTGAEYITFPIARLATQLLAHQCYVLKTLPRECLQRSASKRVKRRRRRMINALLHRTRKLSSFDSNGKPVTFASRQQALSFTRGLITFNMLPDTRESFYV